MSVRRWGVALLVILSIIYLKYSIPTFDKCVIPALRSILCSEQILCVVPNGAVSWLRWD